jgi:hypothetical protein
MNKNFDSVIKRLIEMSADGGLSGTYDNSVISLNFKVDEKFDLDINEDTYRLNYITEINASPAEVRFKKSDIKEVKHYAVGEFPDCECCEVIELFFNDSSQLDFFEDLR